MCAVHVITDVNRPTTHERKPFRQLFDVGTQFYASASDADCGEFCADFPSSDEGRYITENADNSAYANEHFDDNYQVMIAMITVNDYIVITI